MPSRWLRGSILGAPSLGSVLCFENHYPRFRGTPSGFFKCCPKGRPSVDLGLVYEIVLLNF